MTTLCQTYPTLASARRVADALHAAGVPARHIGVLADGRYHDLRAERVGGFGGPVDPESPFGKYAGPARRRWQAAGGFSGRPDRQRQGSFADGEGPPAVTYDHDGEQVRITGDDAAGRVLAGAQVERAVADRMLEALHHGGVVMFADVSGLDLSRAEVLAHDTADAV